MAATPQYVGSAKSPSVTIATANTSRDGTTGAYGTLLTAGASGSRIDKIRVNATGTTNSGMLRFFVGTALIYELPVFPTTPSATLPAWYADVVFDGGLVLQASAVLKASTNNAESFTLTVVNGGDF